MKIKDFCKQHKKVLIITGSVIGVTIVTILMAKGIIKDKKMIDLTGESVIHWKPENKFMNLESVKEILDLNADNASQFAIFREGPNPADYVCIVLSEGFVPAP